LLPFDIVGISGFYYIPQDLATSGDGHDGLDLPEVCEL